jgi:hypothetical protein
MPDLEAPTSRRPALWLALPRLCRQPGELGAVLKIGGVTLNVPVIDVRIHALLPSIASTATLCREHPRHRDLRHKRAGRTDRAQ